jgi:branched-chain amino acid aminotransferase
MTLACLDGAVVPIAEAHISVTDEGLLRGDGVFEVLRLYEGVPFALDEHMARMSHSAENLRLPLDIGALEEDIRSLLAEAHPQDGVIRAVATRGGRRVVLLEDLPDLGASMSLGFVTYSPTRVLDGIKSLSYGANVLASRLARERGHDEALLVTPHGRVLEAPTSSFFWVRDGRVFTPPLDDHLLDSITRRLVVDTIGADAVATTREDVLAADEAFLASTLREVLPVRAIEDRQLPVDGPVTSDAGTRVRDRIAALLGSA